MGKFYFIKNITKADICLISVIITISTFLFFWNVEKSSFFQSDEYWITGLMDKDIITLLNNYIENSYGPSTIFLPLIFLSKPFFFINSFPSYRYISSFYSVIGILVVYFTVKMITGNNYKAFLVSLVFSTNQFIVYSLRQFMVDPLIVLFTTLVIYFYFKWYRSKKTIYLLAMFIFLAIDIYNHGSAFFLTIPLLFWFILLVFMKKIKLKQFFISVLFFMFIMIPSLFLLNSISIENSIEHYYYILGMKYSGIDYTINLYHFNDLILTPLSRIFSRESLTPLLTLLFCTIISYSFIKITDENKFLIFMSISVFLIKILSPVPSRSPTHFLLFFILFVFSLVQNLDFNGRKIFFFITILAIITFGFTDINQILFDRYSEFQSRILKTNNLILQRNIYNVFNYLNFGKQYNLIYYECSSSEQLGIIDNETFNRVKHFSSGDIIVADSKWCNTQTFDNRLWENLEFVDDFDGMCIYRVK